MMVIKINYIPIKMSRINFIISDHFKYLNTKKERESEFKKKKKNFQVCFESKKMLNIEYAALYFCQKRNKNFSEF